MARPQDATLQVYSRIAEAGLRFALRREQLLLKSLRILGNAHAFATTALRGLDHDREADLFGEGLGLRRVVYHAVRARNGGHIARHHRLARRSLVAHQADLVRRGADERQIGARTDLAEFGVLREEAVTRVNRLRARNFGRRNDARDVEIAVTGGRFADAHVFVREANVKRFSIGFGVNGDSLDAQLMTRANDTEGDFATIGDEDFFEH